MNKKAILKKMKNELTREVSEEVKLISFRESIFGEKVVLVSDIIKVIDTLAKQETDATSPRTDEYEQLVDGEPITMMSNEIFKFKCCDCGLIHNMVIGTEEKQEIGFVVEQVTV